MADTEISYDDAFSKPEQTDASNQNIPPPVTGLVGKSEYSYDEAVGNQLQPGSLATIQNNLQSVKTSTKNILNAFAEPFAQTGDDIGQNLYGKDGGALVQAMKKVGMFQPYVEDQNDFNKGFLYRTAIPAVHNLVAKTSEDIMRGVGAVADVAALPITALEGVSGALSQGAEELPEGGVKELAQYALNSPLLGEAHEIPRVPRTVAESEAAGVIGTTEGQNLGVEPLTEDQHVKQTVAESEVRPVAAAEAEPIEPVEAGEQDIHTAARVLEPETFKQYDALQTTREDLRKQLSDMQDIAEDKVLNAEESQNYHDLKQKVQETNSQLRELAPKVSDAYLQAQQFDKNSEVIPNSESPNENGTGRDVGNGFTAGEGDGRFKVRTNQSSPITGGDRATSIEIRSSADDKNGLTLALDKNGELKQIASLNPGEYWQPESAKELNDVHELLQKYGTLAHDHPLRGVIKQALKDIASGKDVDVGSLLKEEGEAHSIEPLPEMKEELANREAPRVDPISADIEKQLIAAGRPAEEARASSEVAARMYQYMADVYGGSKGTAQDFYEREKANVVAGKERATVLAQGDKGTELGQGVKGRIRLATSAANAVITLMKNADASTFLHESAHHFLDMMDRFSKEAEVPDQLKKDMDTIRKWSGLSEKVPETPKEKRAYVQAQEKFARGFERYLMEGVAPTRDLAQVFAKFKNWLNSIYKTVYNIPGQRGGINEDVRGFFDRVLSRTPEKTIIAPERSAELAKNISSPKLKDLFGNVQKAPQSLSEFLASKGGLKDEGGDLASMDAKRSHLDISGKAIPFKNKLVKDDGLSLDDAARLAEENGYFPEKGGLRPTVEELKDKISEDLGGNKQFSDKDHEALRNHQDALKYNAEADRISNETGIESEGKTHDQFWSEVEKYYRDQKQYKEAQEIASDALDDYKELERKQREFMENRGEAWEAPKTPKPRTLEDIDNERKQEQAADDALSGTANPQEPRGTAGVGQPGETGVQQVGGGIEPNGRQDAQGNASEDFAARESAARQQLNDARSTIADAPIGDTRAAEPKPTGDSNQPTGKSEFIDKAGNIRLDLLTDSNSVKAAMREAAEKNPQIFNHGVITDAQVAEFADAMGTDARNVNIQKLREISVNDDIPLAARIRSGSQMMVDALNNSLELMKKENPSDEDVSKFLEAKNQFMMIAETVSATTNEIGRGLRAYNNLRKEYNITDINEASELFQRMTGSTLDQVKAEMKIGSLLKTPKQIAKFTQDSFKPDFFDKLIEYRNNSLLSGPVTHTMYTAGGFLNAGYKPLQTLAGVGVQTLREAFGGEIEQRMYAREALEQFKALGYGSMRGLRAAAESWKQNSELALPKEITSAPLLSVLDKTGLENVKGTSNLGWLPRNQAIGGKLGSAINVPSRVIGSIHSFLKMVNYQQNLASLAVRDALGKGFDPASDEYAKYISDTIDNPTSKMMDAAGESSLKEVYREKIDYNSTSGKIFNAINNAEVLGAPVGKILFPFIKMQYNIKRLAFRDNSVLGFLDKSVRADISGVNGDVAKNMAIGKIAAGTTIAGLGVNMTLQGLNNGSGPSDPKAYKTWRLTHTPNSVQVGSIVIPHKALGTWGQLLSWSADMAEGAHEFDSDQIEKSAWQFVQKAGAVFTEEGFLTQAKNTLDAAFTPQQFGSRFIQNFADQWLPFSVGASQTNRLINDPYSRRVKSDGAENLYGIPEAMAYKYPGTSELLHVNRDMFGRPVTFDSSYDQYANDPVVRKLESLNTGIGRLSDKIRGIQLDEQQYDDYTRIAGQTTYARLSKIIGMDGFNQMPPQHQLNLIEHATTQARSLAANSIMKMNPQIMRQAIAKKRMSIYGNKAVNDAEEGQTEDATNP